MTSALSTAKLLAEQLSEGMIFEGKDITTIAEVTGLTESFIETFLTNREG